MKWEKKRPKQWNDGMLKRKGMEMMGNLSVWVCDLHPIFHYSSIPIFQPFIPTFQSYGVR
jgi:hypothetical protein